MARHALTVCRTAGCATLTSTGLCTACAQQREIRRGSRQARGYGRAHEELREQWRPMVEAGIVDCKADVCTMPIRRILPGQAWHLDHDDDRTGYRGPAHARCNVSQAGKAAHGAARGQGDAP